VEHYINNTLKQHIKRIEGKIDALSSNR
jgi:hypothetical protein